MFVIDVDALLKKIPRPERSGLTGAAMAVGCLLALVTQTYPLEQFCQLLPWGCPAQVETAEAVINRHRIHWLLAGPSSGKSSGCYCHQHYEWWFSSGKRESLDSRMLLSCDDQQEYAGKSAFLTTSGTWQFISVDGRAEGRVKFEQSWVCSKKGKDAPPAAPKSDVATEVEAARNPKRD